MKTEKILVYGEILQPNSLKTYPYERPLLTYAKKTDSGLFILDFDNYSEKAYLGHLSKALDKAESLFFYLEVVPSANVQHCLTLVKKITQNSNLDYIVVNGSNAIIEKFLSFPKREILFQNLEGNDAFQLVKQWLSQAHP